MHVHSLDGIISDWNKINEADIYDETIILLDEKSYGKVKVCKIIGL